MAGDKPCPDGPAGIGEAFLERVLARPEIEFGVSSFGRRPHRFDEHDQARRIGRPLIVVPDIPGMQRFLRPQAEQHRRRRTPDPQDKHRATEMGIVGRRSECAAHDAIDPLMLENIPDAGAPHLLALPRHQRLERVCIRRERIERNVTPKIAPHLRKLLARLDDRLRRRQPLRAPRLIATRKAHDMPRVGRQQAPPHSIVDQPRRQIDPPDRERTRRLGKIQRHARLCDQRLIIADRSTRRHRRIIAAPLHRQKSNRLACPIAPDRHAHIAAMCRHQSRPVRRQVRARKLRIGGKKAPPGSHVAVGQVFRMNALNPHGRGLSGNFTHTLPERPDFSVNPDPRILMDSRRFWPETPRKPETGEKGGRHFQHD